jgi:putative hemolysin
LRPQRYNDIEVRLAETAEEIAQAQDLRYRVFYEEMGAKPDAATAERRRDIDRFDAHCDHLLTVDHGQGKPRVVGTYRLLRGSVARRHEGFYSAAEYSLAPLVAHDGEILELGRSCIDKEFRNGTTMLLLWRGIAAYITHFEVDVMFGCGSLPGTDPAAVATVLSYLHHFHLAPEAMRPRALDGRYVDMKLLPQHQVNPEAALNLLPPLLKGYIRLGGWVGDGAVIDHQFNTVDVCIVLETERLARKYARHYIEQAERAS